MAVKLAAIHVTSYITYFKEQKLYRLSHPQDRNIEKSKVTCCGL